MEKPSSSDPNFKAFLNKLKEQNGDGSLLQKDSLQNVDNSKSLGEVKDSLKQGLQGVSDNLVKVQDRLDTANSSLSNIADAIQGNALERAVEAKNKKEDKEDKEEVDNFDSSLMGRLKSFMTDGESDKPGYGIFQKPPPEVVKKEREDKVSSPREVNPEADNINTSAEIQADAAKKDLELSKEMLDTTKEELTLLKEIKDALAPKTPAELGDSNAQGLGAAAGAAIAPEISSSPGVNIDLPVPGLPDKKGGKPGKETGKAGKAAAKGIGKSLLKKIPIVGAVAGLAYGASRAMSGDFAGAGMEVASGLAGTIPGVGTAASVGIDAALAAKDAGVFDKEQTPAPTTTPATAPVATASKSLGGAIAATADTSKKQEAMLTPVQEKEAKPLIDEMLSLQKELLELNNNFSMPRDEYKAKRKEIGSKQAAITKQLDSIKSGFGQEVLGYTSGPGALDASKETSSSVIDKMKQDSKTISEESSKVIPKEKVTGEKIISQTTTKVKTTSSDSLTKDASSAQESLVGLEEKYAKKAAPIVEKLRAEGKIEGVVTDEDYQQIPELQAIKKEKDAEKLSLEAKIKPGLVSSVSSEVAKTSTENADMSREMGGRGGANNTVVSNNISSNNTTKFVPMKSSPRAENTGSALDRYTSRITTY